MADGDDPASGRVGLEVPFSVGGDIDFSVGGRLEWLRKQPLDVVTVIAVRAALRVIPAFSLASDPTGTRLTRRRMALRVFRAVAAVWTVSAFPAQHDLLREAAKDAVTGLGNLQLPPSERAAAYALAALLGSDDERPSHASTAISYALDAAGVHGKDAFDTTLQAIMADADLLSQRYSSVTIANSQLWPKRTPEWAVLLWDELKHLLLSENEGWEVWTRWYEARLSGAASSNQMEVARATTPDDAWQQSPAEVNRQIAERIDSAQGEERRPARLQGAHAVGQARAIGTLTLNATAEVIPNAAIEAAVSRIRSDPQVFEDAARFAARSIERELKNLATKIPNEPGALDGYQEVRSVLEELQTGFEALATSVQEAGRAPDVVEQITVLRKAVLGARAMSEGFVEWLNDNGNKAGRVIAELGLAGVISGTLSYYVGVPPMISFPVTVAALEGKSIWDAVVLFAPKAKRGDKSD
jgi:hypothetical protein